MSALNHIRPAYNRAIRPAAIRLFGRRLSVVNGVAMRRQAVTDLTRVIDIKSPMYAAIGETVSPGDHVIDIAAGRGGFAVKAANQGATVDSYEAAERMVVWATDTVRINAAEDRVTLHHAIVGDITNDIYGPTGVVDRVSPGDLPPADGLILDCEGAELDILPGLVPDQRPEYVIVETHPRYDAATADVRSLLGGLGYTIAGQRPMVKDNKHAIVARRCRS